VLIHGQVAFQKLAIWIMADVDKYAVCVYLRLFIRLDICGLNGRDHSIANHLVDNGVPNELDFLVGECTPLQSLPGTQFIATVKDLKINKVLMDAEPVVRLL